MSRKKRLIEQKRKAEALKKAERNQAIVRMVGIVIIVLIIAIIAGALIFDAAKKAEKELNYSIGLNEDGKIKGVNALKYVELCDFNALNMNAADFYPSKEDEEQYIAGITESYPDLSDKKGVEVKEKDMVNIDYVGTIDGVEYEGGNTNKKGIVLTLGVGNYPTDFENGIIGHKTGETFNITVDYDADFANEELAGKSVDYEITINGVFVPAEFNDAFVKEYLSDVASTKEEYIQYYKDTALDQNLKVYISDYIRNYSTVNDYPKDYLKTVKGQIKNTAVEQYESVKESLGTMTFEDYVGQSKKEYEASLTSNAMKTLDDNLKMQAICEDANLTVTEQDVKDMLDLYGLDSAYYSSYEAEYGKAYLYQTGMAYTVIQYVQSLVNITD